MKINPRHIPVEDARRDLARAVSEWRARHALGWEEVLLLLHEELGREIYGMVKHEWKKAERKAEREGARDE